MISEQRRVRLFCHGRNQAIRVLVEFELPGDEVHREGDRLVIEPVRERGLPLSNRVHGLPSILGLSFFIAFMYA